LEEQQITLREKRWHSIASSVKVAIRRGELSSGMRIPSETEMAAQWNVSPMTVHRALTDLQREGWVVRRPKVGTVVADREMRPLTRIGLVFPTLSDQPQSDYLAGIEDTLREGYQLLPFRTGGRGVVEASVLERAETECDAVICYATSDPANTPLINRLAEEIPVLFVDRLPDGVAADVVATDNQGSIIQGLRHLYAEGHRRIAYFMEDSPHVSAVRERRAGYAQFMTESGAADPLRWLRVLPTGIPQEVYYRRVETLLIELLTEDEPITAVACQQALTMTAVLEACVRLGIKPPSELGVLGFNDHSAGHQALARDCHRLVQRSVEMGHMAAKRIEHRLSTPGIPAQQTRVMADFFPAKIYQPSPAVVAFLERKADGVALIGAKHLVAE